VRPDEKSRAIEDEGTTEGSESAGPPAAQLAEALERLLLRQAAPEGEWAGEKLVERIRGSVIGEDVVLDTPFGPRKLTYADYTASGRALDFIEAFVALRVLPFYANTHTEASATGSQSTHFREEARRAVMSGVGANPRIHAAIFVGGGVTGAVHKLASALGLLVPREVERYGAVRVDESRRPVVIVGPTEHHSNEVLWRETICTVHALDEGADGHPSVSQLEGLLRQYEGTGRLVIVSLSAGSNVTGICPDTVKYARLARAHGALNFWDYAGSGAYVDIQMAPEPGAEKDAVFLSPHKMIGGPGSSGVLVVRKGLMRNRVPVVPGGGTVSYVTRETHAYDDGVEGREEGGTPNIVADIRTGLAFAVKAAVGPRLIERLEHRFARRVLARWGRHPSIRLVGMDRGGYADEGRTTIFSFVVTHRSSSGEQRLLHHHFVCQLLNDLYGIQSRSGCSCAGPYGARLIPLDAETSETLRSCSVDHQTHAAKPGWCRGARRARPPPPRAR